jgi:hypothetical protein
VEEAGDEGRVLGGAQAEDRGLGLGEWVQDLVGDEVEGVGDWGAQQDAVDRVF